jgi:hypothetical protein
MELIDVLYRRKYLTSEVVVRSEFAKRIESARPWRLNRVVFSIHSITIEFPTPGGTNAIALFWPSIYDMNSALCLQSRDITQRERNVGWVGGTDNKCLVQCRICYTHPRLLLLLEKQKLTRYTSLYRHLRNEYCQNNRN